MAVFKKLRSFTDTRNVGDGIPSVASGNWLEIEFKDEDTDAVFIPDSIIIKLDIAVTALDYSFSTGTVKHIHGRIYTIGNLAPPNGSGQEEISEVNTLATKIYIRADDENAIARIWGNRS